VVNVTKLQDASSPSMSLNCARQADNSNVKSESDSNPPDITLLCRTTLSASVPPVGKVVARSANAQLSIESVFSTYAKLCAAKNLFSGASKVASCTALV
jgi:hypothetical protein